MAKSQILVEKDLKACQWGKMGRGYDYMQMKILDYKIIASPKLAWAPYNHSTANFSGPVFPLGS